MVSTIQVKLSQPHKSGINYIELKNMHVVIKIKITATNNA
jgi:hypothetical protein